MAQGRTRASFSGLALRQVLQELQIRRTSRYHHRNAGNRAMKIVIHYCGS
jgi:hypothetical protein